MCNTRGRPDLELVITFQCHLRVNGLAAFGPIELAVPARSIELEAPRDLRPYQRAAALRRIFVVLVITGSLHPNDRAAIGIAAFGDFYLRLAGREPSPKNLIRLGSGRESRGQKTEYE